MAKFIIKDWVGKVCFNGVTFNSFTAGWDYIYQNDPEPPKDSPNWKDNWFDDYFVEVVTE
jgi:hypothetical protein